MEFGALTGATHTSGASLRERDLNETAGPVARNDNAFGNDIDISKAQLPEGCRELGYM